MEFPFGHHQPPGDNPYGPDDQGPPPPPPPPPPHPYGGSHPPPPPPYGGSAGGYGWEGQWPPPPPRPPLPPPPPPYGCGEGGYAGWEAHMGAGHEPGPGYPAVRRVAHKVRPQVEEEEEKEGGGGEGGRSQLSQGDGRGDGRSDDLPSSVPDQVSGETSGSDGGATARQRTVRVFTQAAEDYSLSIREGKVVLARADHRDEHQHWIKDEKFSTKVKDEEGFPSFALVNKVTGEAIKHSIGAKYPVRLALYNPDYLDESILWTESRDSGGGFRCIRMVNNIRLRFDAFQGDDDRGGVHDGTTIVLREWPRGKKQTWKNQLWKIVPY